MNRWILAFFALTVVVTGCSPSTHFARHSEFKKAALKEVSGTDLNDYLRHSDRHVLVEFGVDGSCGRCESMRSSIVELAEKYKSGTDIVRVDFSDNVELVTKLGGSVCPTYVLFEKGRSDPSFIQSFPVSCDHLEAEMLALLALSSD